MKIFKMHGILATAIIAFAVCNLTAGETNSAASSVKEVPRCEFNFINCDPTQVLDIYAKMAGVELKTEQLMPGGLINFSTQKPLTRSEAIQALEKIMREQAGIVLKPLDAKHVKVTYDASVKLKN